MDRSVEEWEGMISRNTSLSETSHLHAITHDLNLGPKIILKTYAVRGKIIPFYLTTRNLPTTDAPKMLAGEYDYGNFSFLYTSLYFPKFL